MSDTSYPTPPGPETTAESLAAEALVQRFGALARLAGRHLGLEAADFEEMLTELRALLRRRAVSGASPVGLATPEFHQLAMTAAMTVLARRRAAEPWSSASVVSLEAIRRLAEGDGSKTLRSTLLVQVDADARYVRELALLRAVLAGTTHASDGRRSERRTRWLAAGVAALVVVIGIALGPRMRAPGASAVAPVAQPSAPKNRTLAWPREPGAVRYTVEIVTAGGDSILTLVTRDTALALVSLRQLPADARWRVITRLADGTDIIAATRPIAHR